MHIRIVLAFLVAPVVPSLLLGIWSVAQNAAYPGPPFQISHLLDPGMTKFSYIVTGLVGVPIYFFLRARLGRSWKKYVLCGSLVGCVPAIFFQASEIVNGFGVGFGPFAFAVGVVYGAVGGFTFWLIGIEKRASERA